MSECGNGQTYQDLFLTIEPVNTDGKLETAMKVLIGTLILCGALTALAGPAVAERVVSLNCAKGTCSFSEELGPDQTHAYRGFCAEENPAQFKMVCHAVKGTTCDGAMMGAPPADYWYCSCTNWDPTAEKHVTIDLDCED